VRALALLVLLAACADAAVIVAEDSAPATDDDAGTLRDDGAPALDAAPLIASDDASSSFADDALPSPSDAAAPDAEPAPDAAAPDAAAVPTCPTIGAPVATGNIAVPGLIELSGLVLGETNPDVYWAHNDSTADLYAIDRTTLALRARFRLTDAQGDRYGGGDVEDIALRPIPGGGAGGGGAEIFLGDIGSGHPDNVLHIYRVIEPMLPPASMDINLTAEVMDVIDGRIANAETLLVDPLDGTLVLVLKAARAFACVVGPYAAGTTANPMCPVLITGLQNPSGGDVSPDGRFVALRNENLAYVWERPAGATLADAFNGMRCDFPTLATTRNSDECNGEAIGFTRDGLGLVTASERGGCATTNVHTYAFSP